MFGGGVMTIARLRLKVKVIGVKVKSQMSCVYGYGNVVGLTSIEYSCYS